MKKIKDVGPVVGKLDPPAIRRHRQANQVAGTVLDQCPGGDLITRGCDLDSVAVVAIQHEEVTIGS